MAPIPKEPFAFFLPHPYVALGAPYGKASPWMLRISVIQSLENAQKYLDHTRKGWKIKIFDAYRPIAVQAFMLEQEYARQAKIVGLSYENLTAADREDLTPKVLRVFAPASEDPLKPPPHSTGAVIDCTLVDEMGHDVDMGSPIDENSDRSNPDHFAKETEPRLHKAHENREFLNKILEAQGFHRNETEWWHFSKGDQMWVYNEKKINPHYNKPAIYGRIDP